MLLKRDWSAKMHHSAATCFNNIQVEKDTLFGVNMSSKILTVFMSLFVNDLQGKQNYCHICRGMN